MKIRHSQSSQFSQTNCINSIFKMVLSYYFNNNLIIVIVYKLNKKYFKKISN